jgi:hypothetical protein
MSFVYYYIFSLSDFNRDIGKGIADFSLFCFIINIGTSRYVYLGSVSTTYHPKAYRIPTVLDECV